MGTGAGLPGLCDRGSRHLSMPVSHLQKGVMILLPALHPQTSVRGLWPLRRGRWCVAVRQAATPLTAGCAGRLLLPPQQEKQAPPFKGGEDQG